MIIKELKYKSSKLKFKSPFKSSKQTLTERTVLILEAVLDDGISVFGEAAPLSGFSKESFSDLLTEVESLAGKLNAADLDEVQALIPDLQSPSLKFALEQIFVSANNINKQEELVAKFNLLFSLGKFQTKDLEALNNSTVKLKLGIEPFEKEMEVLHSLTEKIKRNNIRLRIDVNANWTVDQTLKFSESIDEKIIEYIEQPVQKTSELIQLADNCSIPIAADESVYEGKNLEAVMNSKIKYLIVKPTVFGGLAEIEEKVTAHTHSKEIIISSALESSLGWSHLVYIANKISPNNIHGLSTFDLFTSQPYNIEYAAERNTISLLFPQNIRGGL